MKRILILLVCALLFQGCAGLVVRRATEPSERHEEIVAGRVEIISSIPAGNYKHLRMGSRPVSHVAKNTVKWLQEELRRTGQTIFINSEPLVIQTLGGNGKWYTGWVEPGTIFLAEREGTAAETNGVMTFRLVKAGICRNPVRGVSVRVIPATLRIVERYRDTDYTPAIWAGLGGLAVGVGAGYLLFHHAASAAIGTICPGGMPVAR